MCRRSKKEEKCIAEGGGVYFRGRRNIFSRSGRSKL